MDIKKKILFLCVGVVVVGAMMVVVSSNTIHDTNSHKAPYVSETNYPIVETSASFRQFKDLDDMYKNADVVALVTVQSQNVVQIQEDVVNTQSRVEVKKVYKGDEGLKSLTVSELGGLVDLSKVTMPQKSFVQNSTPQNYGIIETAMEGSPVMQQGHTYFVLLVKNPNPKWGYNIVGSVQGKIRIDGSSNEAVATVTLEKLQSPIFFFQNQFAGKKLSEIEKKIYELKLK